MMRIQSACLEQTIFFETEEDFENYKSRMSKRHIPYAVVAQEKGQDGSVVARLKKRYTHYDTGTYLS